jgi:type II secretory pathway pseudopilin PulG
MMRATSPPPAAASQSTAGFSLVEVLIAAFILLIIALGLMPLFTRSIQMNVSGNDSTQLSNMARSRLEELYQMPFDHADLSITAGSERTEEQHWSVSQHTWLAGPAPRSTDAPWVRTTRIRQFALSGLIDDNEDGELDQPLPANTNPQFIHAKEIQVRVESNREIDNPLARPQPITLRILRSF